MASQHAVSADVSLSANEVRSVRTQAQLVESALESLIELGFARTTGVEVCRRASLTRGALTYHFADFGDLLAAALATAYERLLDVPAWPEQVGPVEGWVYQAHRCAALPEFKAILELWLASRNDPDLGARLSDAIALGAPLFDPVLMLADRPVEVTEEVDAVFRTITETFIGLGVGRSVSGGHALGHEQAVVDVLIGMARDLDRRLAADCPAAEPSQPTEPGRAGQPKE